ncbi:integrator complex subunit 1-like [Glandiceps talaboti]
MATDRGKASIAAAAARKIKSRAGHPPSGIDFIALGAKSRPSGPELSDIKPSTSQKLTLSGERKRESPSTSGPVSKKPKLGIQGLTSLGKGSRDFDSESSGPTVDSIAVDVKPVDFIDTVLEAECEGDDDKIDGYLCGCIKNLRSNRAKPDTMLYLSLMYLVKLKPYLVSGSEVVVDGLCNLLKRDVAMSFKSKGNPLVSVLACNILLSSFSEEENWPEQFVRVYVEDSLGERVWVDNPKCAEFVQNIQTAFATKVPKKGGVLYSLEGQRQGGSTSDLTLPGASPGHASADEDDKGSEVASEAGESVTDKDPDSDIDKVPIIPRYLVLQESIECEVVETIREQLTRRQPMDTGSRNMLRLLTATSGIVDVRVVAAPRLEMWLQNPKLTRPAQDLLMSVCLNCNTHTQEDVDVIGHLIRIRLKTKPLINHYMVCIRELLNQHAENLFTILKHTIYNELSNSRNPNNMPLLGVIFQHSPEPAAKYLAMVFQELLANREDYGRAVRALLREIVRQLRYDISFTSFAMGLMTERSESQFTDMESQLKDRLFTSLSDLIALTELLSVTPQVKDVAAAFNRGERRDKDVLHNFHSQISLIQRDAIWWLHTIVPTMFKVNLTDYVHCLQKVLYLEQPDTYFGKDNWPPEADRAMLFKLLSEVPVQEDTLMRVLVIGLSRELPLAPAEALDLADKLVRRAAMLYTEDLAVLKVERTQLMDAVLNLCGYHHPENIALPKGYQPPQLAISNLYWKGWLVLLVVTAFNPVNIGQKAWEEYPMLKCLMEMCMTNHFSFPPPTMATDERTVEEIRSRELQLAQMEKQEILEFESHLAAASTRMHIDESSSLLLAQLTSMDPHGVARRPPSPVLEELQTLNQTLKLGNLLCRSRAPDFLLDIIQRQQGASQSMPWLAELVESSDGSLDVLPVQCLCEFLLHDSTETEISQDISDEENAVEQNKRQQKLRKQEQLLNRLQSLLYDADSRPQATVEILDYFLCRLSSQQQAVRSLAAKGLSMLLNKPDTKTKTKEKLHVVRVKEDNSDTEDDDEDDIMIVEEEEEGTTDEIPKFLEMHGWLLKHLPLLPQFKTVQSQACYHIRQACQMETDPVTISAYIMFLSKHSSSHQLHEMADLALDLAQLIVERPTILSYMLPKETKLDQADITLSSMLKIFYDYLKKATQPHAESYSWSDTQDQVFIHWQSGEAATMHILVVHAMVILLTYGKPTGSMAFDYLLSAWFPETAPSPSAFLVDTSEEALLLPDWLKLRMIRSNVGRLVDAALEDLEPAQLVLFVQSFGIPVNSMSKLLQHLDLACTNDMYSMEQAVVDKGYMAQLVEVQQMRGAGGGSKFHGMLQSFLEKPVDKAKDDVVEDMTVEEKKDKIPEVVKTKLSVDDSDTAKLILLKLFSVGDIKSTLSSERRQLRTLQQALSKEISTLKVGDSSSGTGDYLVQAILGLIESEHSSEFITKLHSKHHLSCPLINLLYKRQKSLDSEEDLKKYTNLLSAILKRSESHQSVFTNLLHQYVNKHDIKASSDAMETDESIHPDIDLTKLDAKEIIDAVSKGKLKMDKKNFQRVYHHLVSVNSSQLAEFVDVVLSVAMVPTSQSSPATSEMISELLLEEETKLQEDISDMSERLQSSTAGLLIDWSELLDPDILKTCPHLQQQLLFTKKHSDKRKSKCQGSCSAYLLALLTHQSNWKTLHQCINWLLRQPVDTTSIDSTAALDFLWACIHIPKLWQGRDTKTPKKHTKEDMFYLSSQQVCTLSDLILAELSITSHDKALTIIESRLPLLMNYCHGNKDILNSMVNHLLANINNSSGKHNTALLLLTEVYLQQPELIQTLSDPGFLIRQASSASLSFSQFDILTHGLISTLAKSKSGRNAETKMNDANIALRKLATSHPTLLLRQLSMISAALRGRVHLTFGEFRSRHHLLFFSHMLGLLELLRPYIFEQNTQLLHSTFSSYFHLIQEHGGQKLVTPLITKFLEMLYSYSSYDQSQAMSLLQKYSSVLHDLSNFYPEMPLLKSLVATVALPSRSNKESQADIPATNSNVTESLRGLPSDGAFSNVMSATSSSRWSRAELKPLMDKLTMEHSIQETLEGLQELDDISKRKVDILQYFTTELMKLMVGHYNQCSAKAYTLAMRHIRQKPSDAKELLPAIISCLDSSDSSIVNAALQHLPEFSVLCQEHAPVLLQKAFIVGVNTKIDTAPIIAETLQLLNMESATAST